MQEKDRQQYFVLKATVAGLSLAMSAMALSQEPTIDQTIEEVTVVGSQIQGVDITGTLPVSQMTAEDMHGFGIVDDIVKEPLGGAHVDPETMARNLKKHIKQQINELKDVDADKRIEQRIRKYEKMGNFVVSKVEGNGTDKKN